MEVKADLKKLAEEREKDILDSLKVNRYNGGMDKIKAQQSMVGKAGGIIQVRLFFH